MMRWGGFGIFVSYTE